jgi:peroxiredoxin
MATEKLIIGSTAPDFNNLPGTDGKKYSLKSFAGNKCLVVVFSCNHCPYVQAYEERMIALQRDYAPKGLQLVAINANETTNYPEDGFEHMAKRSKEQGFNFIYLRDNDQSVAQKFGATHTPEFFLFDEERKLRYHGKMDDNYQNPGAVKTRYLQLAIDAVLSGGQIKEQETYSIGCTIKWKS